MDELIARLMARHDISAETARHLVAIVLQYLASEAPAEALAPVIAAHPWIEGVLAEARPARDLRHFERLFGGMAGLMEVADRMMSYGLTMAEVQETVRDIVGYARENVGDEAVDALVRAVPGLWQVV